MRSGNGNGRISKYNRQVAEQAGLKKGESLPYAPDFLDSLVRRMAIPVPGEIAERCLAWLIYRANGNQSLKAIHLYSKSGEIPIETELRQQDCALELAWVEAGHRVEWLDAPRDMFQAEAQRRGVKPIDKSRVSEGFQFNRIRGSMEASTGFSLVYIPSPKAESFSDLRETCRRKGETPTDSKDFTDWAQVAHIREFQKWRVLQAEERELRSFLLRAYKKSKKLPPSETNGGTSLEALESLEPLEPPAAAVVEVPAAAAPPFPPPSAPIESYVAQELSIDDEAAQKLVASCKEVEASITGPEIVEFWHMEAARIQPRVRAGNLVNPVGLLLKTVPKTVRSNLQTARDRIEAQKQERAARVTYAREAWDGLNEIERAEVLEKYPELAEVVGQAP